MPQPDTVAPGSQLATVVATACRTWPERVAVVELASGVTTTYADLDDQVSSAIHRLQRALARGGGHDVTAKPVIAIESDGVEGAGTLAGILACAAVGGVALVRNPAHTEALWQRQLEAAAAPWVLRADGTVHAIPAAARTDRRPPAARTYQLVATSGSTGTPKLVQLTDRGTLAAAEVYRLRLHLDVGETVAVPQSLSSVGALPSGILPALLAGGTAILAAGVGVGTFTRALAEHDVVFAMAVTGWWQACLRATALPDLPRLRLLGVGGSPWQHLAQAIRAWLPAAVILGNYGLTETHGPALQVSSVETSRFAEVTGRAVGGMEVEIRDDSGRRVPVGEQGMLWLRGALATPGYLRVADPVAATAEPDAHGWLCTGDIAALDPEGWVHVVGRADDLVNVAGRKVYPAEVELALHHHPEVADCAVVTVTGPGSRRRLAAFVVARPASAVDAAELRRWVAGHVGGHAVPHHVDVVAELPVTGTGKVDRACLALQAPSPEVDHAPTGG